MPSEEATRIKKVIKVNDILEAAKIIEKCEYPKVSLYEWFFGERPNIFKPSDEFWTEKIGQKVMKED